MLLVLLISWISSGQGQNVKITKRSSFLHKSIYTDLNAKAFCFRRTNGTHQFGCSSDPGGNVGVVHLVKDGQDVSWIVDKGIQVRMHQSKFIINQYLHILSHGFEVVKITDM